MEKVAILKKNKEDEQTIHTLFIMIVLNLNYLFNLP